MKMSTTLVLLVLVVLAALAVIAMEKNWFGGGKTTPSAVAEKPLFEKPLKDVSRFQIAPKEGIAIELAKEGDKWLLTSPVRGPAKQYNVEGAIRDITDLKVVRTFAAGDRDRPTVDRTGLDKPELTVRLSAAGGETHTVKIGQARPVSRETYVQVDQLDTVYLVKSMPGKTISSRPGDYRDTGVLGFDTSRVRRLTVAGAQQYELDMQGEAWRLTAPVKGPADKEKVDTLLRKLSNLQASSFVNEAVADLAPYGLDNPRLTLTVSMAPPGAKPETQPASATSSQSASATASQPATEPAYETLTVSFGAQATGFTFAKRGDEPWLFRVKDEDVDGLAGKYDDLRNRQVLSLKAADVTAVAASQAPAQTQPASAAAAAGSVSLAKVDGQWKVKAPVAGAAEGSAVDALLSALAGLKASDFVDQYVSLAGFGLESPAGRYELTATGQAPQTLLVGSATRSGQMVFVKLADRPAVMTVTKDSLKALSANPAEYWSREILQVNLAKLASVEVAAADRSYRIDQPSLGRYTLEKPIHAEADQTNVQELIKKLNDLKAEKIVFVGDQLPARYSEGKPTRVVITTGEVRPLAPPQPASEPASQASQATQPATAPATAPAAPPVAATQPAGEVTTLVANKVGSDLLIWVEDRKPVVVGMAPAGLEAALSAEMRDRVVWKVAPEEVQSLTLTVGETVIPLAKAEGGWSHATDSFFKVDSQKVQDFLTSLRGAKAERFVTYEGGDLSALGLDKPERVLHVQTAKGPETLSVSAKGPEGQTSRYAMTSQAPGVFVLPSDVAGKLQREVGSFAKDAAGAAPPAKPPMGMPGMQGMPEMPGPFGPEEP